MMVLNYLKVVYFIIATLSQHGCRVRPTISHGNRATDDEFKYVVSTYHIDYNNNTYYLDFRNARDSRDGTFTVPSSVALYTALPDLQLLIKSHFINCDADFNYSKSDIENMVNNHLLPNIK